MRKFVSVLLVVVSLVALAVPAFAVGESGSSDTLYYPVINFNTIDYDDSLGSYTIPYPFNSGLAGVTADFSYFDGWVFGSQNTVVSSGTTPTRIHGTITIPGETAFYFRGGQQVVAVDTLKSTSFYITTDSTKFDVSYAELIVSYSIIREGSDNEYESVNGTYYSILGASQLTGDTVNVGAMLTGLSAYDTAGYLFINSISLYIAGTRIGTSTYSLNFQVDCGNISHVQAPADFNVWFNAHDLDINIYPDDEPDEIFGWLGDSIRAFLEFEIFPGFSVDKIFTLVLVIGIMLWFITLLI